MKNQSLHDSVQKVLCRVNRGERLLMPFLVSAGAGLIGFIMAGRFAVAICFGCLAFVLILAFVRGAGFGGLIALLLVGLGNGLPFVDLSAMNSSGSFSYADPLMISLILLGCANLYSKRRNKTGSNAAWILSSVTMFMVYWCFVVLITTMSRKVPLIGALLYGRYFLAILLVPVMIGISEEMTEMHSFTRWFVWLCVVFGASQALQTFCGLNLDFMTHPIVTNTTAGLFRVYSSMQPLTVAALLMCAPLYQWADSRRERLGTLCCAGILITAIAAQLSRALWLALAAGLLVASLLAFLTRSKSGVCSERPSPTAVLLPFATLLLGAVLSAISKLHEVQQLTERFGTSLLDLTTQGGTFGYRLSLYRRIFGLMHGHWLVGLGFLHPKYAYIAGLPGGGLQNSDLGILSIFSTMGFIGVFLITLPAWISLVRSSVELHSRNNLSRVSRWMAVALLSTAISSSATLTFFASQTGLAAVSIAIAFSTMNNGLISYPRRHVGQDTNCSNDSQYYGLYR